MAVITEAPNHGQSLRNHIPPSSVPGVPNKAYKVYTHKTRAVSIQILSYYLVRNIHNIRINSYRFRILLVSSAKQKKATGVYIVQTVAHHANQ